jgi:ubiquinone/menaquinone biosynthesis C-methylase UbiE
MSSADDRTHWQRIYAEYEPRQVSWYEPRLESSLALIAEAKLDRGAAVLDVGGGASSLPFDLLDAGYLDITVADISASSLDRAREQMGEAADRITWVEADVRDHDFGRLFDLWHDRALFHFMVQATDRDAYLETLRRTLRPGGHLLIATFGPQGPTRCSGLPAARYGATELSEALGDHFKLLESTVDNHRTPSGKEQQFLYARMRRAERVDAVT